MRRFLVFIACFSAWSALWIAVRPSWLIPLTAAIAVVWTIVTAGPAPVLTVACFALACRATGRRIHPGPALSIALGAALYMFVIQCFVWMPVNTRLAYVILIATPILLDIRSLRTDLNAAARSAASIARRDAIAAVPLLLALLCQWLTAWKPEVGADALAMHLTVPAWIAQHGFWHFDIHRFVYAVMPMGANWLFTAVYLPGGEMAARLLNFGALMLTVALIRSATGSSLAAALYASTPVLELVTGSLFVENTQAAFALSSAMAVSVAPVPAALLAGAAMMTKLSSLTFVAPLALLFLWRHWRAPARQLALSAAVFLLWAVPPYLSAMLRTGNPVFPLGNAWFRAAGFGTEAMFTDPRYAQPLSLTTLYDLTFHSSRYFEGWDGAFGLQWLLLPLALAVAAARGNGMLATGITAAIGVLATAPNLRYLVPALALLAPSFAGILALSRIAMAALLLCFAANLFLLPSSSSWHRDFALDWLDSAERRAYVLESAPARPLIDELNQTHRGKPVLFLENTHFAGLNGRAYSNSWYHYGFASGLEHADSIAAIEGILKNAGIERILAPAPVAVPQTGLAQLLERRTRVVARSGPLRLYELLPGPGAAPGTIVLAPGRYENHNAALVYTASWRRQGGFPQSSGGSVTYSEVPGATMRVRFRATGLRWIFTRAPNRGIARIRIDDRAPQAVDLYAARAEWQAVYAIDGLAAGEHTATIEVTGTRAEGATAAFIDVDSIEIR